MSRLAHLRQGLPLGSIPVSPVTMDQGQMNGAITQASFEPYNREIEMNYSIGDTHKSRIEYDGVGTTISSRTFTDNLLHQIVTTDGTVINYDAAGNLVFDGKRNFKYDTFRRLTEVSEGAVFRPALVMMRWVECFHERILPESWNGLHMREMKLFRSLIP